MVSANSANDQDEYVARYFDSSFSFGHHSDEQTDFVHYNFKVVEDVDFDLLKNYLHEKLEGFVFNAFLVDENTWLIIIAERGMS